MTWFAALALLSQPAAAGVVEVVEGVALTVRVVDAVGDPVPTAVVRSPIEGGLRHPVNHETGEWTTRALYPDDGSAEEVLFHPGDRLILDVSAPGYITRIFQYDVAPWRNLVTVVLEPLGTAPKTRKERRRARKDLARLDWTAIGMGEGCGQDHPLAPVVQSPALSLDPDTMFRLGELRQADPELTAAFALHLMQLGAAHADAALAWADLATKEARAALDGEAYVHLVDDMYRVRAVATNLRWQADELERVDNNLSSSHADPARKRAAQVAEDWVAWTEAAQTDRELALALCHASSEHTGRCR